jgi:hypothetical protein
LNKPDNRKECAAGFSCDLPRFGGAFLCGCRDRKAQRTRHEGGFLAKS